MEQNISKCLKSEVCASGLLSESVYWIKRVRERIKRFVVWCGASLGFPLKKQVYFQSFLKEIKVSFAFMLFFFFFLALS